jgi:undecaprenyl phosphate-alpha-L-ara4N flippase subunit ArnE
MLKHESIAFSPRGIFSLVTEPRLIIALSLYGAALLIWLQVLSKAPLSTAYPVLAITYVLVPLLSIMFFDERINRLQVIGICLVLAGVTLIGANAGE